MVNYHRSELCRRHSFPHCRCFSALEGASPPTAASGVSNGQFLSVGMLGGCFRLTLPALLVLATHIWNSNKGISFPSEFAPTWGYTSMAAPSFSLRDKHTSYSTAHEIHTTPSIVRS